MLRILRTCFLAAFLMVVSVLVLAAFFTGCTVALLGR